MQLHQVAVLLLLGTLISQIESAAYIVKDIRDFGAEGDGVSWDHYAFNAAAAFFNARGGNGKLTISPGLYIVGKQIRGTPGQTGAWLGFTVMEFNNVQNFTITGIGMPKMKYLDGLRFGSFDTNTGEPIAWGGTDYTTRGDIGSFLTFGNSLNIEVSNFEVDGNSPTMILGGGWGDVGRQLGHDAIDMVGNMNVVVSNVHAHHFGKDGMQVGSYGNPYPILNTTVQDCRFESNGRQGMSWIGGTGLRILRSSFNHQGYGAPGLSSPPGAGFDVEQEMALNRDAYFEGNEFLNNAGCQFVADSGDSANIYMTKNVLWGVDGGGWSWWVVKPDVVFTDGQIFGSTVHGYSTDNYTVSTRHFHTYFSDPLWYDGRWTASDFLLNVNYVWMLHYERCTFITTWRKPMWSAGSDNDKPLLQHQILYSNIFVNITDAAGQGDYGYICRGTRIKGDRLEWAYGKQHFYVGWGGNTDSGGTFGVTSPDNTTNQWE